MTDKLIKLLRFFKLMDRLTKTEQEMWDALSNINISEPPSILNPIAGMVYLDSHTRTLLVYDGAQWVKCQ